MPRDSRDSQVLPSAVDSLTRLSRPRPKSLIFIMSSFITNLFPSSSANKHEGIQPVPPPPLHSRSSTNDPYADRPKTPSGKNNNFITPVSTPQGSPSKSRNPPGANDLPNALENGLRLTPQIGSPAKLGRGAGTPLSPGKPNTLAVDDGYFGGTAEADSSVIHKSQQSPGSPLRKQGKENTTPGTPGRLGNDPPPTPAALSRQELYQSRETTNTPSQRKYNTQRRLTPEELEILNKPNVKRLANVTQLCKLSDT